MPPKTAYQVGAIDKQSGTFINGQPQGRPLPNPRKRRAGVRAFRALGAGRLEVRC